jgi:hypothetical protein
MQRSKDWADDEAKRRMKAIYEKRRRWFDEIKDEKGAER